MRVLFVEPSTSNIFYKKELISAFFLLDTISICKQLSFQKVFTLSLFLNKGFLGYFLLKIKKKKENRKTVNTLKKFSSCLQRKHFIKILSCLQV
jgi:hypothetical protein